MKRKSVKQPAAKSLPIIINLPAGDRETLQATAALFEMDLASYAQRVLIRQAKELRKQSNISLSRRDFTAFMEMCAKPDKPNPALRAAFRNYYQQFKGKRP